MQVEAPPDDPRTSEVAGRGVSTAAPWTMVAWLVAGVGWALAGTTILLTLITGYVPVSLADWVMDLVVAGVYGVVIAIVLPRARHLALWILAAAAWGCGLAAFAEVYASLQGHWPGQGLAFYAKWWAWIPGVYATVAVIPLVVVEGWPRWRRPALCLAAVAILLAALPGLTVVAPGLPDNPLGIQVDWWQGLLRDLGSWPDRAVAALGAVQALWLGMRVRRTPRAERRGLGWLLAGHTGMVAALVIFLVPLPGVLGEHTAAFSGVVLLIAQVFLPAALLVLVLGRQLWGVELSVSRATVWVVMTVTVALTYLALVALAATLVPSRSDVVLVLAVGLLGLGSAPLRSVVQGRVDRLVYGSGADPARLWSRLQVEGDDLVVMTSALSQSLRLAGVRVVPFEEAGTATAFGEHEVMIALTSRGRPVGALVATARPGERLDARTIDTLEGVAGLVGLTVDLTQANEALTAARSRMTSIRMEERRLLRRDLHDGLGPALAGIRLGLVAARNLREADPDRSERMLDEVAHELSRQGEDVRRLSRSLLPLALDQGDLGSALRELAARFSDTEVTVSVSFAVDLEPTPAHQVCLYHVASEALLNVRRHAAARHCELVVLREQDGGILLEVADDGIGLDPAAPEGVGLRSMRERAAELGGTVTVVSPPGRAGTRVTLALPTR